jgi:hypothetical protein
MPPITKIKDGTVNVVGGWFLRQYIQQFLGKDWFQSFTMWGLVIIAAAQAGFETACNMETMILSIEDCQWIAGFFDGLGRVLVVVGLRRRIQT